MKAELVPENGDDPIPIHRDITVFGRRSYCDVVINHTSLSKRHAVLIKTDGLLIIRDLISTNGTKVKGQRVRWAALLPGDRIALGAYKFRVYLGPDDLPAPSERVARGERLTHGKSSRRPAAIRPAVVGLAAGMAKPPPGAVPPIPQFPSPSSHHAAAFVSAADIQDEGDSDSQWRDAMYAKQPLDKGALVIDDDDLLPDLGSFDDVIVLE